jgi:DNA-binding MarR family transcriptional regulator
MAEAKGGEAEKARIMLGLLESVEQDGARSQRHLAAELGIALGLVNAYLRRCISKGLVKISEAPARRYAYYLTPQGFAEKSRLTLEYMSYSFAFFREAKSDCADLFQTARSRGFVSVVVLGASDLAEIATICALESGVTIVAVVDSGWSQSRFVGFPVVSSFDAVTEPFDGVVITDLLAAPETVEAAVDRFGADRVLVPRMLAQRIRRRKQAQP